MGFSSYQVLWFSWILIVNSAALQWENNSYILLAAIGALLLSS
jgi:hypothetical protein